MLYINSNVVPRGKSPLRSLEYKGQFSALRDDYQLKHVDKNNIERVAYWDKYHPYPDDSQ